VTDRGLFYRPIHSVKTALLKRRRRRRINTWNRQSPGKMKMKMAARLPRKRMTSPMLGMRMAQMSDVTNHGVAIRMRRARLVSAAAALPEAAVLRPRTSLMTLKTRQRWRLPACPEAHS
jgi:hypothetical protein